MGGGVLRDKTWAASFGTALVLGLQPASFGLHYRRDYELLGAGTPGGWNSRQWQWTGVLAPSADPCGYCNYSERIPSS